VNGENNSLGSTSSAFAIRTMFTSATFRSARSDLADVVAVEPGHLRELFLGEVELRSQLAEALAEEAEDLVAHSRCIMSMSLPFANSPPPAHANGGLKPAPH
jgi:hypothetical protein